MLFFLSIIFHIFFIHFQTFLQVLFLGSSTPSWLFSAFLGGLVKLFVKYPQPSFKKNYIKAPSNQNFKKCFSKQQKNSPKIHRGVFFLELQYFYSIGGLFIYSSSDSLDNITDFTHSKNNFAIVFSHSVFNCIKDI